MTHERDKFQVLGLLPAPRRVGRDWRTKNLREKREIFNFLKSSELLQKKARARIDLEDEINLARFTIFDLGNIKKSKILILKFAWHKFKVRVTDSQKAISLKKCGN